jgi:hypothetical protein
VIRRIKGLRTPGQDLADRLHADIQVHSQRLAINVDRLHGRVETVSVTHVESVLS